MRKNAFVKKNIVLRGIQAMVNFEACVGCEKCIKVCPADTIVMRERAINNENY